MLKTTISVLNTHKVQSEFSIIACLQNVEDVENFLRHGKNV